MFTTCQWHVHVIFTSWRVQDLLTAYHNFFTTWSWLVDNLFTYIQIVHSFSQFFQTCSEMVKELVHNLFTTRSQLNLFMICSQLSELVHNFLITSAWLVHDLFTAFHNFFTIFLQFVYDLQSYEFTKTNKLNRLAGLSLAQLSPSLFWLTPKQLTR